MVLLGLASDVVHGAVARLVHGGAAPHIDASCFAVMLATLFVNLGVARYETRAGQRLDSSFLIADAAHTRSDVFVTLGVLASMAGVALGFPVVDAIAALAVAGFIAWAGITVLRANLNFLVDAAHVPPEAITVIVTRVPGVASAHKIRSRGTPQAIEIDLHIQIARHLDVVRAHAVTHAVMDAIKAQLPGVADVVVHTEPAAVGQPYAPLPNDETR